MISQEQGELRMKILTYRDLRLNKGLPWTRQHLLREEKAGRFPKRVRLGPSTVGWVEEEIDNWFSDRAASREVSDGAKASQRNRLVTV